MVFVILYRLLYKYEYVFRYAIELFPNLFPRNVLAFFSSNFLPLNFPIEYLNRETFRGKKNEQEICRIHCYSMVLCTEQVNSTSSSMYNPCLLQGKLNTWKQQFMFCDKHIQRQPK